MSSVKTPHQSFAISTFGCKVNQYESQVIRERLRAAGYREEKESPQLVIINSCAVTARAEAKTRKCIRSWLRRVPRARLVLTGCGLTYSERQNRSLWEIVPPSRRGELPRPEQAPFSGITYLAGHSRAFVKVQDGCDSYCAYCIIPFLRGREASRHPEEVAREVALLAGNGYREIVLTGINLGKYAGAGDAGPSDLSGLIELLLQVPGSFRIRLSSIEPKEITTRLIYLIAREERLCPHLHIPLQSGSDTVLRKMNRNYTFREYREIVRSLRVSLPDISLTTDCLVGFPDESEEDFRSTCRAVREIGFSKVHVFPYSPRAGTKAALYPGLGQGVIKRRAEVLGTISEAIVPEYRQKFRGREVQAVIERKIDEGLFLGLDEHYIKIAISGEKVPPLGSLRRVRITEINKNGLRGVMVME
ncbi:MAG: MiaB/RimO family radical SAM methylthiotransferase [Candidatus Euphemobacter frigidus]|nr:MiaB/RimO family radical SAM methylthiotransferase [Candidatus Euphemobacter frigidus]MDP8276104.1 MiaB/RimO family radical SAM methylthiotransferase [Candidatus Euphemobacter frigidus]